MKRMKRLGALLLALCMLFSFAPVASAANGTIKMTLNSNTMTVNGQSVKIDTDSAIKPQVKKVNGLGYTMLPLRAVVESMGGTVAYDAATKVITMTYGGNTMKHTIGTSTATVNGAVKSMAIASYAANNRTYVHLRAIELLSSSVKVNWSASAPNDVTITYPQTTVSNGTKTVSLTIKNSCSTSFLQFTSLQLAPAGTTTYSGNLLSETLTLGGTRTLTMAIQPGKYDLKGIDMNGNVFGWKNLDFTNVQSNATLTLTTGSMFTLSVDNTLTGAYNSSVTIYNNTGAKITGIKAFQANSTIATEIYSGTLYSGYYTTVALPYGSGSNVYYLTVTFENGKSLTYNYITIDQPTVTIALRGDGTFTYGGVASGEGVYFVNRTGGSLKTVEMKLGKDGEWSGDLLDGTLKAGDYMLLEDYTPAELRNMTVYFRTTSSGSGKSVEIASSLKNSVVFYYGSSLKVEYNVNPADVEYEEGLYIENTTDLDFDEFYVLNFDMIDEDDYEDDYFKNWDLEDYFEDGAEPEDDDYDEYDASDYYDDYSDFEDGDILLIDEWNLDDLASADIYFKGWVDKDGDKKEDSNELYFGSASIGKASKFDYNVYMELEVDSEGDLDASVSYDYTEEDYGSDLDEGLLVWNNSGYDIDYVYFSTKGAITSADDSDIEDTVKSLDEDEYDLVEEFDDYDDLEDTEIFYYIEFSSTKKADLYGSFTPTKSDKDNVCLIVESATKADYEYDWYYEDDGETSELADATMWIYNDTGFDFDKVELGIGDSEKNAEKDASEVDLDRDFDDEDLLQLEGIDYDDIVGEYIYLELTGATKDDEDLEGTRKVSTANKEFDYVLFVLTVDEDDDLVIDRYYDDDADEFIEAL